MKVISQSKKYSFLLKKARQAAKKLELTQANVKATIKQARKKLDYE
jgi:predicted DNA-binding protein (UPF0251 family)